MSLATTQFDGEFRTASAWRASAVVEPLIAGAARLAADGPIDISVPLAQAPGQAVALLEATERLHRLAEVARVDAIAAVHASGAYRMHGHATAHAMARHLGRLSTAETARADKIRRLIATCERIETAWRAGDLSVEQAGILGRAFANPRVRDQFVASQARFLRWTRKPLASFERKITNWVQLVDQDGPEPRRDLAHENRDISLVQDHFTKQWTLRGTFGALQGATLRRILDAYTSAERLIDWDTARERLGDSACRDDLDRTDAQQRADALEQIFADALHNPERSVPIDTVHNIVWSKESFEDALRRFLGEDPEPVDVDDHRCHSLDGHELNPRSAFGDLVVSRWRRIVCDAQGITIDASKTQRFFTGLARLGVQLSFDSCFWPGCSVPVTECQIDHQRPAARGGRTEQSNGAPACQKHNRLKERGYAVRRLPDGTIQVTAPNGDILPA